MAIRHIPTPKALSNIARTYVLRHTVIKDMAVKAIATPVICGPMVGALGSLVLKVQPMLTRIRSKGSSRRVGP